MKRFQVVFMGWRSWHFRRWKPGAADALRHVYAWVFHCGPVELRRWRKPRCRRHDWAITGTNGFGLPSEEQCLKCGMYHHRVLQASALPQVAAWESGRHPN